MSGAEKLLLSGSEAAELLGISKTTVHDLWNSGELAFVRIGRGRKVSRAELHRFIAMHEEKAHSE
ncbi:helix-turn-helix domain-containing protein [Rhodococcus sp. 2G]|uniref:helix-turn-helix domain-containing protein n=1 Tax=Rhodococcus sp. 2G TaxID=1570939 RepID=UPI0009032027|nr:helix-turn-helix domain-containing protein [Rhodococcus sp. 2G]